MPTRHDLLFTYDFPPMGGGIARWMAGLAQAYSAGTLVVSTGAEPGAKSSDAGFPNRIDRVTTSSRRLRALPGLLGWCKRGRELAEDPAARFAWCGTLRPAAWPAWWAKHRTGLPYGVVIHGGDILVLQKKLRRAKWKRPQIATLIDNASVLVANSHWTAERTAELLDSLGIGKSRERIRVVNPGTDPRRWIATRDQIAAFKAKRNLPEGRYLITVARLVPHKGIGAGIEVLAGLVGRFPALRYLVVGNGPHLDTLREIARMLGVSDRVHFLTDVTDDELGCAYRLSEIYLGLSQQHTVDVEGFGISYLEAAAAERPVVAGSSGGVADAVEHGATGLLVVGSDPGEASAVVEMLLNEREYAAAMGAAGRERVLSDFTWQRVATRFQAIATEMGRPG